MLRSGSPAPADAAIARNVRAYDAMASTYDASHPEIFNAVEQARLASAVRDVLAAGARTGVGPRVLDVGAGTGNLSAHFLEAGATVISADVSPGCLRVLSQRFQGAARHAVQLIDGRSLGVFADATFDVAACYSVLHHVPDYLALVAEMARVVRPGGLVYLDHERHDTSWHDPVRAQCMREVCVFPPKRWMRFINPRKYWNRLRPVLQWQRWFDRRWMPEGDLHIWPDDHIEWARVEARALDAGVTRLVVRDYLLFESRYNRVIWEQWKDRVTDYRMWVGQKQ